jgi:demethylmenaquinone methyltransferase / 2-methoxy-6-polyprenyl-1,4-benzoquinol methylase
MTNPSEPKGLTDTESSPAGEPLPPHPTLGQYYGEPERREEFLQQLFDDTAEWYDQIGMILSFGSGERYRREALQRAGLTAEMRLLDLATGTGVVARAAASFTGSIVLVDASLGMILAGRRKATMPAVQAFGEKLPFGDASFDMLTIGYALRHFSDLRTAFTEFRRVLRPGGKIVILEITAPRSRLGYMLLRFHINHLVPFVARLRSGNRETARLMHYYWDTIAACVPPERIMAALGEAGFEEVMRHVELGIFSEYRAIRAE